MVGSLLERLFLIASGPAIIDLHAIVAPATAVVRAINVVFQAQSRLPRQTASSLDHLVGDREQNLRHIKTERPSSLEIDYQLEFGRLLDRQVTWLLAAQNAIDIYRCLSVYICLVRAIGTQGTTISEAPKSKDRRQSVASHLREDEFAMQSREGIYGKYCPCIRPATKGGHDCFNLVGVMDRRHYRLNHKLRCGSFC